MKRRDRLVQTRRAGAAFAERFERDTEIVLGRCPVGWDTRACPLLERRAIGHDRLFDTHRTRLAFAELEQRLAELVLRRRPVERRLLA
jgi:hypothetical protein